MTIEQLADAIEQLYRLYSYLRKSDTEWLTYKLIEERLVTHEGLTYERVDEARQVVGRRGR
jgi:hypothetical protein